MSTRLEKLESEQARAEELHTKYLRLATKARKRLERATAAADREREKWHRSGKCPHCRGSGQAVRT